MKTEYKYIIMKELNTLNKKTKTYSVINKKSQWSIGVIKWYSSWRQYCFFPSQDTVYSRGCLDDIADFIFQLMKERNNNHG